MDHAMERALIRSQIFYFRMSGIFHRGSASHTLMMHFYANTWHLILLYRASGISPTACTRRHHPRQLLQQRALPLLNEALHSSSPSTEGRTRGRQLSEQSRNKCLPESFNVVSSC
jgi:hypothetical protein